MRVKLVLGFLLLFGMALVLFRSMRRPLPIRYKNPFALLQTNPSDWKGLVGADRYGHLKFDTVVNGVRAGFINLIQYFNSGLVTIGHIVTRYAPENPGIYIQRVVQETGFGRDEVLSKGALFQVGRAIVEVEAGTFWVDEGIFLDGWRQANAYRG